MLRWTDLAEWRGPTVNQGPAMAEQRGLVVHIAEGFYEGTISWQKKSGTSVSSHFVLAGPQDASRGVPDGKLAQIVDLDIAAWTQRAGNGHWVSVECSGFTPNKLSAAQCESIAQLMARGHKDLGWPLTLAGNPNGKGLGYHSMGTPSNGWTGPTWGHEDCPGPNIIAQLPAILERAKQIVGGDDMSAEAESQIKNMYQAWFRGGPSCGTAVPSTLAAQYPGNGMSNSLIAKLDHLITKVEGGAAGITVDDVRGAMRIELDATALPAVPGKLGKA